MLSFSKVVNDDLVSRFPGISCWKASESSEIIREFFLSNNIAPRPMGQLVSGISKKDGNCLISAFLGTGCFYILRWSRGSSLSDLFESSGRSDLLLFVALAIFIMKLIRQMHA